MKPAIYFMVLSLLCTVIIADNCDEESNNDCEPTEYTEYIKCIRERTKRDVNCRNQDYEVVASYEDICNCDIYNCKSCDTCRNSCDTCCNECCNTISTCTTNHCCHNYCHTTCRDSSCRNSCKRSCREKIITNNNNNNNNQSSHIITTTNNTNVIVKEANVRHNITTIINLKNFINNTNSINVPIVFENTNLNNITTKQTSNTINNNNTNTTCCLIIGPKQCIPQDKFPFIRCFHIRKKHCSPICLSPILHYHQYEFCDIDNNNNNNSNNNGSTERPCQKQTIYIPQPRPRCAYHPVWPYVNCNGNRYQSCEGCYNHYINPFELNPCSPFCYDDGYGIGPYYRQGPFYRPGYSHIPSCYQTGYCNIMGDYNAGSFGDPLPPNYGGFGAPLPPNYGGIGGPLPPNYGSYNGGYYQNFGGFNNIPTWNLGYPPHTYNTLPFIIDSVNDNGWNDLKNRQDFDFLTNNPNAPPPSVWSNNSPPKDVSIEAQILTPRATKYAEIKIQPDDNESPAGEVAEVKEEGKEEREQPEVGEEKKKIEELSS